MWFYARKSENSLNTLTTYVVEFDDDCRDAQRNIWVYCSAPNLLFFLFFWTQAEIFSTQSAEPIQHKFAHCYYSSGIHKYPDVD